MEIRAQSIAKKDGAFRSENEDAVRVSGDGRIFAISDGAGGTGVEAHRWSQYLLEKLPAAPLESFADLQSWQDAIWQAYFDDIHQSLEKNNPDALHKFLSEGSSATLAAVWLSRKGKSIKATVACYGDSVAMLFRPKTGEVWTNIASMDIFLDSPFLLNSNEPPVEHGYFETWPLKKGDWLLLASDTLGQLLLGSFYLLQEPEKHESEFRSIKNSPLRYAAIFEELEAYHKKNTSDWLLLLGEIWEHLESAEKFEGYTNGLRSFGVLGLDDYSAVFLRA